MILTLLMLVTSSWSQQSSEFQFPEEERPRQFRMSDPVRSIQTSESLSSDLSYPPSMYVPVGGCGENETLCADTEQYPDQRDLLNILNTQGELDILRSLYHHQDQDEGQTYSRLPPRKEFDIVAEDAEAPLGQGDYVGLRTIGIGTTINTGAFPPLDLFEEPLCHEKIEYIYPKTALTKNKQWRFVINLPQPGDDSFVQAVRVRRCLNPEEPCTAPLCEGRTGVCRQEFDYTKLLAISDAGTKYVDEFMFPSGCKCYSRRSNTYKYMFLRNNPQETELDIDDDTVLVGETTTNTQRKPRN